VHHAADDPRDDASAAGVACCDLLAAHGLLVPSADGAWVYSQEALALIRHMVTEERLLVQLRHGLRRESFAREHLSISAPAICLATGQHEPQTAPESGDDDDQEFWDGI